VIHSYHSKLAPPLSRAGPPTRATNTFSFLRFLFPRTRQRARARLSAFRHDTLPYYRQRAQSRIYRFIVKRQEGTRRRRAVRKNILGRLGGRRRISRIFRLKDAGGLLRSRMAQAENPTSLGGSYAGPSSERGSRRRKLAGYLKAANELRQSYQQSYGLGGQGSDEADENGSNIPGAFPNLAVVRHGDEEMVLFPSYARRHHRKKHHHHHHQEVPGASQDIRSNKGSSDAEYWRNEWEKYEDENAIVDVDIRGWIYSPHRGPMTRKNRLLVGIARHLSGIPAPQNSQPASPHSGHRDRLEARAAKHEDELAEKEAESITRIGESEAKIAWTGGYSEEPDNDRSSIYSSASLSRDPSPERYRESGPRILSRPSNDSLNYQLDGGPAPGSLAKRASWNQPADMSPAELAVANAHLLVRLKPFLTNPVVGTPLTVFFYNDKESKSRTTRTNEAGHFTLRAALDFVPTHVRVLASEKLSATEEVHITEPKGISMISDIDDTIKHSAIGNGAKEMFRNTFIRELGDLTIEGVKEWYNKLADLGVKFHYVSNSPWQLYPVLVSFFAGAGLPKGSFHLKQYSGMLQGIFEPVAERKKGTLEKIMSDFPERRFILAGDSGEADLELYTDIVLANPGRVLGVFIRDVTTTQLQGFFDSSVRGFKQTGKTGSLSPLRGRKWDSGSVSATKLASRLEEQKPSLPPPHQTRSASSLRPEKHGPTMGNLIDFDDDPPESSTGNSRFINDHGAGQKSTTSPASFAPSRPSKPLALRSYSGDSYPALSTSSNYTIPRKPPPNIPPKPRKYSISGSGSSSQEPNVPSASSPLSQTQNVSPPGSRATSQERQSYRASVRNKVSSAYNALPSWYGSSQPQQVPTSASNSSAKSTPAPSSSSTKLSAPPPVPPRRNLSSYPAAAAHYASNRLSGTWSGYNSDAAGSSEDINGNLPPNPLSKKEELWNRRLARAKETFEKEGVMLRTWRVGTDVMDDAVKLVERAMREEEQGEKGRRLGTRNGGPRR